MYQADRRMGGGGGGEVWDRAKQAGGRVDFAPHLLGTLVRRSNHMGYLGGPKSSPHSLH